MGLTSLGRWGWGRGHSWTEPGHEVEVGKNKTAFRELERDFQSMGSGHWAHTHEYGLLLLFPTSGGRSF